MVQGLARRQMSTPASVIVHNRPIAPAMITHIRLIAPTVITNVRASGSRPFPVVALPDKSAAGFQRCRAGRSRSLCSLPVVTFPDVSAAGVRRCRAGRSRGLYSLPMVAFPDIPGVSIVGVPLATRCRPSASGTSPKGNHSCCKAKKTGENYISAHGNSSSVGLSRANDARLFPAVFLAATGRWFWFRLSGFCLLDHAGHQENR